MNGTSYNNTFVPRWVGTRLQTKPVTAIVGTIAYEVDTGNEFIFDGESWQPYRAYMVALNASLPTDVVNGTIARVVDLGVTKVFFNGIWYEQ